MDAERSGGAAGAESARPAAYPPSWIDRFSAWVEGLPAPPWVFYAAVGVALTAVQLFPLWRAGGLPAPALLPVLVFNALAVPYLLASLAWLDRLAVRALTTLRPALDLPPDAYGRLAYQISTMPRLGPLLGGLAMVALAVLTPLVAAEPVRYAGLPPSPLFTAVFRIIDNASAFLFGVFLYHTIRQLRLVGDIYARHVRVDLFDLRPLQAFSRLTAATAVAVMLFVYSWMALNPELLADPLLLAYSAVLTVLALLVFVWPLWGAHQQIAAAKEAALDEFAARFATVFADFDRHLGSGDYAAAEKLNGTIASLEIQRRRLEAIPTWPWQPETARLAVSAIALPMLLMILQLFLQGALAGRP